MTRKNSMARIPLRAELARRVTYGNEEFLELVQANPECDKPLVLALRLADEMVTAKCIFSPPGSSRPRLAMLRKPYQRFQSLCEDVERKVECLSANSSPTIALCEEDKAVLAELLSGGTRVFKLSQLVNWLKCGIESAADDILKSIARNEIVAYAVPLDLGVEGPAGVMLPSSVTETMFLGDDGLFHQSRNSGRAWKVETLVPLEPKPGSATNCYASPPHSGAAQRALSHNSLPDEPVGKSGTSEAPGKEALGPESLGPLIMKIDRDLYPSGPPEGMRVDERRRCITERLKKEHKIPGVSNRTFQRHGIKRTPKGHPPPVTRA
jgi:hypothetical protein